MDPFSRFRAEVNDRYRLDRELGQGGMAIVYLAHDVRHDRPVAVKVIRPELSAIIGADRFLQEIKLTAHLQHPHILPLYDSGSAEELLYYVMPYVAGESLRARLDRERQLPVDETVTLVRALALALDYAHRQGVVHRDIKPENILLQDGQPLLADFGIALALTAAAGDRLTQTGLSLGTPHYMSPEQATGERTLDGRTDIYALGCVTYEMLTGDPPHTGPTAQAILASVITADPRPVNELRRAVPLAVAAAIHRSLEKIPADRFSTGAQFADALGAPGTALTTGVRSRLRIATPAWLIAGAAVGVLVGWFQFHGRAVAASSEHRFDLVLPENQPIALTGPGPLGVWQSALALSPDGEELAYVSPQQATTRLLVRHLGGDTTITLPGTDGAYYPFFSPDGQWLGFFSGNELRKVSVGGGTPVTLVKVDRPVGATWASPDSILVMDHNGFLMRWVHAFGGGSDSIKLGTQFVNPEVLPDHRRAVGHLSSGQLALLSLSDGQELAITQRGVQALEAVKPEDFLSGVSPKWTPGGFLVFGSGDGVLMALPFDAKSARPLGPPVPVIPGVRLEEGFGSGEYALASDGTLIYVPGANQNYGRIAFVSRSGKLDTLPFPRGQYTQLRMSPDGLQLAVQRREPTISGETLIFDLATGQTHRINVAGNYRTFPADWSSDGKTILIGMWDPVRFLSFGARLYTLSDLPLADVAPEGASYMTIAPNGKDLVFTDWRTGQLFLRRLQGDTTRTHIPGLGYAASFSPDGRWLAYGSNDGGIAVSPVPPTGALYQVVERGQQPLWSRSGDRIIYRDGHQILEVPVNTHAGFRGGAPRLYADGPFVRTFAWNQTITADGRVATVVALPDRTLRGLVVVTGLDDLLRRASRTP
jgi:serine/threonine-protein kinase